MHDTIGVDAAPVTIAPSHPHPTPALQNAHSHRSAAELPLNRVPPSTILHSPPPRCASIWAPATNTSGTSSAGVYVCVCVCVLLHISKECPFEGVPFRRSALLIPLHSRPSQISSRPPLLCPHTACNGSTIRPSTIRPLHGPGLISCHDKISILHRQLALPCVCSVLQP